MFYVYQTKKGFVQIRTDFKSFKIKIKIVKSLQETVFFTTKTKATSWLGEIKKQLGKEATKNMKLKEVILKLN